MRKYIICWRNKWSGDEGFVKQIRQSSGYFINTFDKEEARRYRTSNEAQKAIDVLMSYGEGQNNDFFVVSVWKLQ